MGAILRVVDLETLGLAPPATVCEAAAWDVYRNDDGEAAYRKHIETLVNPCAPIPPEMSAIHHITDRDVIGAPLWLGVHNALRSGRPAPSVYVAHRAAFESQWIEIPPNAYWICTWKVALVLWPDAPKHSNQALRYYLGLDLDKRLAMPPHRAGPDGYVTASILIMALGRASIKDMVNWSIQPALLRTPGFGEHRDEKWADIPTDYLRWIINKSDMAKTNVDVYWCARNELTRRDKTVSGARR